MGRGKRKNTKTPDERRSQGGLDVSFLDPASSETSYLPYLRGGASLQGAISAPRMRAHYTGESDLCHLAAVLLCAVSQAHALIDGNKRAAICLTDEFLALNSAHLMGQDADLCSLVWGIAAGRIDEAGAYTRLRDLVASGPPAQDFATRYPYVIENLAS
jgi:death-on-curing protein